MRLTREQFERFASSLTPRKRIPLKMIDALTAVEWPDNLRERAELLANLCHESSTPTQCFIAREENLNYRAYRLLEVFPKYFTKDQAKAYELQPQRIANRVYADRMGNGDEASGDGWKYRGRGVIMLTGKANYEDAGKALGLDLVNNPDLAADARVGLQIAFWFWKSRDIPPHAQKGDTKEVRRRINGGKNGLEDVRRLVKQALLFFVPSLGPKPDKPMTIEEIKKLQAALNGAGFNAGPVDGKYGKLTEKAYNAALDKIDNLKRDMSLLEAIEKIEAAEKPSGGWF